MTTIQLNPVMGRGEEPAEGLKEKRSLRHGRSAGSETGGVKEGGEGLQFAVAETCEDVVDAWQLLYRVYLRAGYISPNPYELHTVPQAIGRHTAVITAKIQGLTVGTISAIGDGPGKLPLDAVYPAELDALRGQGRKLIEIGLFGDRREDMDRSFNAILELMRFTFFFGLETGVTDFICGIPPRRAKLYAYAFGFEIIGAATSYASVRDNPVVLLRSETAKVVANPEKFRAVDYFVKHPCPAGTFDRRFGFGAEEMAGTLLEKRLGMGK